MLTRLHIHNYALISDIDIDFGNGLSVLTGETGAGKSIILGALNLVMGGKADTRTITEGEQRCVIEAEFDTAEAESLLIRRELNLNGRSRSFVNDELVSQAELKVLAQRLIDIHSQHANLLMGDDTFQLSVVDAIAFHNKQLRALKDDYSTLYEQFCSLRSQLADLKQEARKAQEDADYVQFQRHQLDEADLHDGELESLTTEEYNLSHADEIRDSLQQAVLILEGDDNGVLSLLHNIHLDNADTALAERLNAVSIELDDIATEARRMAEQTETDEQRLQQVQERIALLQQLLNKHRLKELSELIALRDRLAEQCGRLDSYEEDIQKLQSALDEKEKQLLQAAQKLTEVRMSVREKICKSLTTNLLTLGIAHPQVDVQRTPTDDFTPSGTDNIQFLFAANLNQSLRRVSEIASGGEISRIMLCIKALTASTLGLPTIIFDEIDTGISGETAAQMGRIMRGMADTRQIIAITHLPQIAAAAQTHYHVYKADTPERTETHIKQLDNDERVQEIATMLAGKNISDASLKTARELLKQT